MNLGPEVSTRAELSSLLVDAPLSAGMAPHRYVTEGAELTRMMGTTGKAKEI